MLAVAACGFVVGFATLPSDAELDAGAASQLRSPPSHGVPAGHEHDSARISGRPTDGTYADYGADYDYGNNDDYDYDDYDYEYGNLRDMPRSRRSYGGPTGHEYDLARTGGRPTDGTYSDYGDDYGSYGGPTGHEYDLAQTGGRPTDGTYSDYGDAYGDDYESSPDERRCGNVNDSCEYSPCCAKHVCTTFPHDILHNIFGGALKICSPPVGTDGHWEGDQAGQVRDQGDHDDATKQALT